jgi:hypothetical protein
LFDETTTRLPQALERPPGLGRHLDGATAGRLLGLEHLRGARVAPIPGVDLLQLAGERQPASRQVELAGEDLGRLEDLFHHLGGNLGQGRHAVDERPVEIAEQSSRQRKLGKRRAAGNPARHPERGRLRQLGESGGGEGP